MATDTDAAASATSPAPTSANNEAPKDSSAPPPRMTPMPDTGEVELLCSQCNNLVPLRIAPPTPLPGDRIYRFFCVTCYPDQSTRQRLTTAAAATAAALAVGWRLTGDGVPPCRQRSHAPESTVSDRYVRKVLNDSGEPTGDEIFLHLLPRSWADATHVAAYNMHILSGRQQTYVDLPATTITRAGRVSRCCQPNHPSRCSLALTSSNATQRSRSPNSLPTHSLLSSLLDPCSSFHWKNDLTEFIDLHWDRLCPERVRARAPRRIEISLTHRVVHACASLPSSCRSVFHRGVTRSLHRSTTTVVPPSRAALPHPTARTTATGACCSPMLPISSTKPPSKRPTTRHSRRRTARKAPRRPIAMTRRRRSASVRPSSLACLRYVAQSDTRANTHAYTLLSLLCCSRNSPPNACVATYRTRRLPRRRSKR